MGSPLAELKQIRKRKIEKLKGLGINSFGQVPLPDRELTKQASQRNLGERIEIAGRIRALRSHGGSTFADLEDVSGRLQIFLSREEIGIEKYSFLELLDIGDFLWVCGELFKTSAGQLSVKVANYTLLTKSLHPLPSSFYGLKDVEERYRQRYVDLIVNGEVRKVFTIRTQVIQELRRGLSDAGFVEVETPILQTIYGGATARPFTTHHNVLDTDLYLRVSDELYLKRLIVGGFEKVYEIGKDFRNEGMDRQHNPEFTMCEFYWAYQDYEGLMDFTQKLISDLVKSVLGSYEISYGGRKIDFTPPWPRVTFREALLSGCGLDVDKVKTEEDVLKFLRVGNIHLDLLGIVGYAPLLDVLYKKVVRADLVGPLFLTDHPLGMKPLAKSKEGNSAHAASFQLIVSGFELINAYNELNDPIEQRKRWEEETKLAQRGLMEYQVLDEDYLRALEYGMPPTAGWGLGLDRFVALMTDSHTVKDVILFPTLRPDPQLTIDPFDPPVGGLRTTGNSQLTKRNSNSVEQKGLVPDPPVGGEGSNPINSLPLEPAGDYPPREKVFQIVSSHIKNQNLLRHCLAVEASMRALARKFGGNENVWGVLGLIHDADWEETKADPSKHTVNALDWLAQEGCASGPIVQGLRSHNRKHTKLGELESIMEWALECADELTGFIVSVALVRPDKKLASVEVESVLKKWKNKDFAAAVDRSQIGQCEEKLGIKLPEFIEIVLDAMKSIASEIGL